MSFGDTAFNGSKFIFWSLTPLLFICGVGLPLLITEWNPTIVIVISALSTCCLLAIPALYNAKKFWWAARGVTGIIFLAYLAYLIYEVLLSGESFEITRHSEASPYSSILGFMIIGLPCLWYTLFGRFTFKPK